MSQAKASAPSPAPTFAQAWESEEERADYHRRLRAAGIDPGVDPDQDMDAFRNQLARQIYMLINNWRDWPRVQAEFTKALQAAIAARGEEDA